jgi:hypothetical protein
MQCSSTYYQFLGIYLPCKMSLVNMPLVTKRNQPENSQLERVVFVTNSKYYPYYSQSNGNVVIISAPSSLAKVAPYYKVLGTMCSFESFVEPVIRIQVLCNDSRQLKESHVGYGCENQGRASQAYRHPKRIE